VPRPTSPGIEIPGSGTEVGFSRLVLQRSSGWLARSYVNEKVERRYQSVLTDFRCSDGGFNSRRHYSRLRV